MELGEPHPFAANQFLFVWKNASDPAVILTHLIYLPVHLINAVRQRNSDMLRGFLQALPLLPAALSHRVTQSKYWKLNDRVLNLPA